VQNSDLSGKEFDDIVHRIHQLHQRWDNSLRFPLSALGERYVRGDLMVRLDLRSDGGEDFSRHHFTLGVCNGRLDEINTCSCRELDLDGTSDDHQFPMLIESVHVMDDTKRVLKRVRSLVWLQLFDDGKDVGLRNSPYFSVISSQFVFRKRFRREDGELQRIFVQRFGRVAGEVPDDMVKTRPQMVDNFASQNAEAFRDLQVSMIINRVLPALVLYVGNDWVFAFFEEGKNFVVEVQDILIGPF